jgi:hypothetical protein
MQERKDILRTDYADYEYPCMIIADSVLGNSVTMGSVGNMALGDVLYQLQYVSISFFNRLLRKLDLDSGLTNSLVRGGIGYISLKMVPGNSLQDKLNALNSLLASDPTIGTYSPVSFASDFPTMQTQLNTIVTQLNGSSTGTSLKNYNLSTGTVYYEAFILTTNRFSDQIELSEQMPWIYSSADNMLIYKSIHSEVVWAPQHFGSPESQKQVHEATLLLNNNNFYSANVAYQSDLSRDFDGMDFYGKGIGVWGMQDWGTFNWGGDGSDIPFRTLVPLEKQRCRFITPRFQHFYAREKVRLLGITFTPRTVSTRGWR